MNKKTNQLAAILMLLVLLNTPATSITIASLEWDSFELENAEATPEKLTATLRNQAETTIEITNMSISYPANTICEIIPPQNTTIASQGTFTATIQDCTPQTSEVGLTIVYEKYVGGLKTERTEEGRLLWQTTQEKEKDIPWILATILVLLVVFAVWGYRMHKTEEEEYRKTGKRPKGYYLSLGMAMGLPIGIPIAIATENPGMIGSGLAIGVAIGAAWENQNKDKLRPLTPQEQKNRRQIVSALVGLAVLGLIVFLLMI